MAQVDQVLNDYLEGTLTEEEAAAEIRVLGDDLRVVKADIEALTPPEDLQKFRTHLVTGIDLYVQGCDKLALGLEQMDPALIEEAATLFDQGTQEIELANTELEENTKVLRVAPSTMFSTLESMNPNRGFRFVFLGLKLSFSK